MLLSCVVSLCLYIKLHHAAASNVFCFCFICEVSSWVMGGSLAERLACWTQVQKGPGSNRSRDAVG